MPGSPCQWGVGEPSVAPLAGRLDVQARFRGGMTIADADAAAENTLWSKPVAAIVSDAVVRLFASEADVVVAGRARHRPERSLAVQAWPWGRAEVVSGPEVLSPWQESRPRRGPPTTEPRAPAVPGERKDPPRTRQSPLILAAFRPWGGSQDDATRGVCSTVEESAGDPTTAPATLPGHDAPARARAAPAPLLIRSAAG